MFVRTKRIKDGDTVREYRQLVENYREDGRHRQRVVAHLGQSESLDEALEELREKREQLHTQIRDLHGERKKILEDLHAQLPNAMKYHGGLPPRFWQFRTSREYQLIEVGRETSALASVSGYDYYGFMGMCGRYWRIPKLVEELEVRVEKLEARLEKLEAIRERGD